MFWFFSEIKMIEMIFYSLFILNSNSNSVYNYYCVCRYQRILKTQNMINFDFLNLSTCTKQSEKNIQITIDHPPPNHQSSKPHINHGSSIPLPHLFLLWFGWTKCCGNMCYLMGTEKQYVVGTHIIWLAQTICDGDTHYLMGTHILWWGCK